MLFHSDDSFELIKHFDDYLQLCCWWVAGKSVFYHSQSKILYLSWQGS